MVTQSVRIRPVVAEDFAVEWEGGPARVIGLVPGQIVTEPRSSRTGMPIRTATSPRSPWSSGIWGRAGSGAGS